MIGYYHRISQSSINRILTTANHVIWHSSQDHTKEKTTELVVNWKDTNAVILRRFDKCCQSRGSNHGSLAWESAALTPTLSGLD